MKNPQALYKALINYCGFKPEVAAIFMMIRERESSSGWASSFNGNIDTGDYSLGLWQINFLGSPDLLGKTLDIPLKTGGSKKYKIMNLVFKDLKIKDNSEAIKLMKETFKKGGSNAGKLLFDPIFFTPIAQVMLLKMFVANYTDKKFSNGWKFTAWGEYTNGPEYGWITKLKIATAIKYYVENTGKSEKEFKDWALNLSSNMTTQKGKSVYSQWVDGKVFG